MNGQTIPFDLSPTILYYPMDMITHSGKGDPTAGQKQCTICNTSVNLLIRCTYDKSGQWGMVCGKCWNDVSGGVVDGDDKHPYYRYGGLWKNRRAQQQQT